LKLRRVMNSFASLSLAHTVSKGIGFGASVLLARSVSGGELGIYATLITVSGYLTAVTNWGSDAIGIRQIASIPTSQAKIARRVTLSRLAIAAVVFVMLAAACTAMGTRWAVGPFGVMLVAYAFRSDWILLGAGKSIAVGIAQVLRECVFAGLVLLLLVKGPSAATALWSAAIADAAWTLATLGLRGPGKAAESQEQGFTVRWLMGEGWPILLVSLMTMTYNKIDVPILAMFRPSSEVGAYWAAYNVVFGFMAFAALLARAALPEMSRGTASNRASGLGATFHLALVSFVVGGILSLLVGATAQRIIPALYGSRLSQAGELLKILAAILPAYFLGSVLISRLVADGKQRRWTFAATVSALANVGANLVLIPRLGATGAAVASVLTEWAMVTLVLWAYRGHELKAALYVSVLWVLGLFALGSGLGSLFGQGRPLVIALQCAAMLLAVPIVLQRVPRSLRLRPALAVSR
jgi:O-antigen/teichoic acid export membrane protein